VSTQTVSVLKFQTFNQYIIMLYILLYFITINHSVYSYRANQGRYPNSPSVQRSRNNTGQQNL